MLDIDEAEDMRCVVSLLASSLLSSSACDEKADVLAVEGSGGV